jgi:glycosyltransferase involved in cell wall biosynthesis
MSAALPVASTDVGDVARVLPDGQRPFVTPLSDGARGLAAALARLGGDAGLRARLGAANRERARERFDFDAMVAAYRDLYRSAIRGSRDPRADRRPRTP